MTEFKPIIYDKVYVPLKSVDRKLVEKHYDVYIYNEKMCRNCEYLSDRHSYNCDICPQFTGSHKLYNYKKINNVVYVGLPTGDLPNMASKLKLPPNLFNNCIDKRIVEKLTYDITFTGTLRDYQEKAVNDWLDHGYGILKSLPRTGKTIMSIYIMLKLGYKVLILANQEDLFTNFINDFYKVTDVKDVEAYHGKRIMGIANTLHDLETLDIALCTYQKFMSKLGKEKLAKVSKRFGTCFIDEAHRGSAKEFATVLNALKCKHIGGLTATPYRKDGRHKIGLLLLGKVVTDVKVDTLIPEVIIVETGLEPKDYQIWVQALNWIASDKERNDIIIKHAVRDIKKGRHILITCERVKHTSYLTDEINKHFDKDIAEALHGKTDREGILKRAYTGETKCVVGMRKLIQAGINLPVMDLLYIISPISNEPNHYQEISRVATPYDGKPRPIIKHFIDDMGIQYGCLKTCARVYFSKTKCILSPKNAAKLKELTKNRKRATKDNGKAGGIFLNYNDMVTRDPDKWS